MSVGGLSGKLSQKVTPGIGQSDPGESPPAPDKSQAFICRLLLGGPKLKGHVTAFPKADGGHRREASSLHEWCIDAEPIPALIKVRATLTKGVVDERKALLSGYTC